jgi:hypothetical protein
MIIMKMKNVLLITLLIMMFMVSTVSATSSPYMVSEGDDYIYAKIPAQTQAITLEVDSTAPGYTNTPQDIFNQVIQSPNITSWETISDGVSDEGTHAQFYIPYYTYYDRYAETDTNIQPENIIVDSAYRNNNDYNGEYCYSLETHSVYRQIIMGNSIFGMRDEFYTRGLDSTHQGYMHMRYGTDGNITETDSIETTGSGHINYIMHNDWCIKTDGQYISQNEVRQAQAPDFSNGIRLELLSAGRTCIHTFWEIYGIYTTPNIITYTTDANDQSIEYTENTIEFDLTNPTLEETVIRIPTSIFDLPHPDANIETLQVQPKMEQFTKKLDTETCFPTVGQIFNVQTVESNTVEWYLDDLLVDTTTGTDHNYIFGGEKTGQMILTARILLPSGAQTTTQELVWAPNIVASCPYTETDEWVYIYTNQSYGDHITITTTEEDQSIEYPLMSSVDIENQSFSGITPTEDVSMTWNTDFLQVSAPESQSNDYSDPTKVYQPRLDFNIERPCDRTDITMKTATENYDEQYNYYSAGIAIHNGTQTYSQIMAFDAEQHMTGTIKAYDQFAPYSHTVDQSSSLGYVHVVEGSPIRYHINIDENMKTVRMKADNWMDSGYMETLDYPNDTQLSYQIQSHIYDEPTKVNIFELYTANYDFEHTPTYTQETNYRTMEFGENVYGHMRIPKPDWWNSSENYQMFISPSGAEPPIITEWTPSTENVTIACEETANFQAYSEDFGLWTWYVDGEEVGEHLPSYAYMTLDEVGTHTLEVELKNDVGKHTNQWTINVTEIDPAQLLSDTEYIYDGTPITLEADQHVDWSIRYEENTLGTDTSTPTTAFDPGQSNQHGLLEFQVEFGNYRGTQTETIDIFIPEEVGYSPSNSIDINPLDTDKIMNGDGHEIFGEITKPYTSSGIPLSALIVSILVVFATAMYGEQKSTVPLIVVFLTLAGSILYSLPIPQYITTPLFAIVAIIAGAILILPFKDR